MYTLHNLHGTATPRGRAGAAACAVPARAARGGRRRRPRIGALAALCAAARRRAAALPYGSTRLLPMAAGVVRAASYPAEGSQRGETETSESVLATIVP